MIDELLERVGLKYEDLTKDERDTLYSWIEPLKKGGLTINDVKTYIQSMKESVENELSETSHNTKQDLFLKARLRNYILLESFLSTPEKAQKAIEKALKGLSNKIKK